MKFEELTAGRIVHYDGQDGYGQTLKRCRGAFVIERTGDSATIRVFSPNRGSLDDINVSIDAQSTCWHDPRGCKR